ncbi:Lrp/AsnC family transcriptional regulator [Runella slithyformis]|uniref:Transcriptional regulator, AsnC family n=1 Tax=Runella slithyformis (strain ATCC 29530 / DSM 19594 / LMG 11500 / NCIMB 11436 / LSU 4) TaxID=761193 RepID=A0A7U3ZGC2_RUNSL|nr:Lrp/AsnC family transcriptional regulator [Runella slithyformis]AEI46630.1 transcriptional regulator, AsnC family [Runella slithyformis DSM 19594]
MYLDETDHRILQLLQTNAQLTIKEIAADINLSITPVHDRIKKLEREGVIEKYVTILNKKRLGKGLTVYCNVTLDKQQRENFQEFNEAMLQMPEVVECCVVSGTFDYLIKIIATDVESYHTFYQEKLATLKAISHISSFFVMSEVKSTTSLPI